MSEFKEVNETLKTKSSESTLGRQLSGIKIFDLGDEMNRPLQEAPQEDTEVENPESSRSEADMPGSDAQTDDAEKKTRELTEEERQELKDKLRWSDEKLNKCTIDKDGVIHYKTDRSDLEGKTSGNGAPYERRIVETNSVEIEGVFPRFDSAFDAALDPDNPETKAYTKECNAKLKEVIEDDPELRSRSTKEQFKDIEEGRTPMSYVWHHSEEPDKMQLVKREDHDRAINGAAHTGGNSFWGTDSVSGKGGESF